MNLLRWIRTLSLPALLAASACSVLPEPEPVRLLDPRVSVQPGRHGEPIATTLNVARPETDPVRDSNRVLVRSPDGELRVHASARWVAPAPELLRTILVRYLRDADAVAQVAASATGSDRTLVLDLRRFELAERAGGGLRVVISADARLYDSASAERLARRRFDHEADVRDASPAAIVRGFEAGLADISGRMGDWLTGS